MKPLQFFALAAVGTALLLYAAPADAALAGAQTSDIPMNRPQPQIDQCQARLGASVAATLSLSH